MATDSLNRKLTAILYTDVAGYSRLTGNDEARQALTQALADKPDLSISYLKANMPTRHEGGLEPYLEGLRIAGLE